MAVRCVLAIASFTICFALTVLEPAAAQTPAPLFCRDWRDCQARASEAELAKDYEAFHDFAWRAVQVGPKNDGPLLFLLARAQVLSGRPHDALVMLERLAASPLAVSALTDAAFTRARELPGWPDVEARIVAARDGVPPPRPPSATLAAPTALSTPNALALTATEAARFGALPFAIASLAYDAVSDRAIVGDRSDRKVVVASRSRATDLVRGDSAGFHDITATEVDAVRGDLWVASGDTAGVFELHRLQLLSGRPLKTYPLDGKPSRVVDIAVSQAGHVFALDAAGGRILEWRPGTARFEPLITFDAHEATSLALTEREGASAVAYVADVDGVIRVDLAARRATRLRLPKDLSLTGIERLRYSRGALVAVRAGSGARHLVRIDLARSGSAIDHVTAIETSEPLGDHGLLAVSGDDLYYLGAPTRETGLASPPAAGALVVYRVTLP